MIPAARKSTAAAPAMSAGISVPTVTSSAGEARNRTPTAPAPTARLAMTPYSPAGTPVVSWYVESVMVGRRAP